MKRRPTMSKIPTRIQRSRTKGSKLPANTLCCTRPGPWSNPFIGKDAAKWFRIWLVELQGLRAAIMLNIASVNGDDLQLHKSADPNQTAMLYLDRLEELRQYDHLGCWCGLGDDCHCDTYIELLTVGRREMPHVAAVT